MSIEEQFRSKYTGKAHFLNGEEMDFVQQGLAEHIEQEVALTHSIEKNTIEVRVLVDISINDESWRGERIIKIKMKKISRKSKQNGRSRLG